MNNYGIKTQLLSAREKEILRKLRAELRPTGLIFHGKLTVEQMSMVGQIVIDLHYRTDDEENHATCALGDWVNQADDWYGENVGVAIAMQLRPTPLQSCFISYSHVDEAFATKLYETLRSANINVLYAPKDIQGGQKIFDQVSTAIEKTERSLIILSENSLNSQWVITEIRNALREEIRSKKQKLFPIRLVDFDTLRNWVCFDADIGKDLAVELREYFIPDFSNWENPVAFEESFGKLLDGLKMIY